MFNGWEVSRLVVAIQTPLQDDLEKALSSAKGITEHNGSLRVQFKVPGKARAIRKSLGYGLTEKNLINAKLTLDSIKRDIANGLFAFDEERFWSTHFPTSSSNGGSTVTVERCFNNYIDEHNSTLSDSVRDKLNTALNWLSHHKLANKPLRELTKTILKNVRKKTVEGNKSQKFAGCAVSTVNEYSQTVSKVLNYAVEEGYIKTNPMKDVPKLVKDNFSLVYEDRYLRPFTLQELQSLLDVIHIHETKLMVKLLAWTGIRHGELKALAWEDVDFENNRIFVRFNITRKANLKGTKTDNYRVVELLPAAREVLEEMFEITASVPAKDEKINYKHGKYEFVSRRRVFLSRGNQPYRRPELTTSPKQWEKWLRQAKVPYRQPYQLRHTYASRLLTAGCDKTWLAGQMGHRNTNMIGKIYGKWIPEDNPDYINQLAAKLGQSF